VPGSCSCRQNWYRHAVRKHDVSAVIEDLPYTLVRDPAWTPTGKQPFSNPTWLTRTPRWSAFAAPAVMAGVRAIFGSQSGSACTSRYAQTSTRDAPGSLSDDQYADALVLATVIARAVWYCKLTLHQGRSRPSSRRKETSASWFTRRPGWCQSSLTSASGKRWSDCEPHAFGAERPVTEVAQDVVSRQLRFTDP